MGRFSREGGADKRETEEDDHTAVERLRPALPFFPRTFRLRLPIMEYDWYTALIFVSLCIYAF